MDLIFIFLVTGSNHFYQKKNFLPSIFYCFSTSFTNLISLLAYSGAEYWIGPLALGFWRALPISSTPSDTLNILLSWQYSEVAFLNIFFNGKMKRQNFGLDSFRTTFCFQSLTEAPKVFLDSYNTVNLLYFYLRVIYLNGKKEENIREAFGLASTLISMPFV